MSVSYPPLKPSNVARHRPWVSDSSFKPTPSPCYSRRSENHEVRIASLKTSQKGQGLPVTIASRRTIQQASSQRTLHQTSCTKSLASSRKPVSTSAQRALSYNHGGHVGAYKNGSPVQRYPSTKKTVITKTPVKFNRRKIRDFQVLSDTASDDEIEMKVVLEQTVQIIQPEKGNFDGSDFTLAEDSEVNSPARSDGGRRYAKLSVGATVRYSKDAHGILMGKSPK